MMQLIDAIIWEIRRKKRKYLREIYRIQPTLKNYIKYFINVDRGNIIRLKLKLNWRKENV